MFGLTRIPMMIIGGMALVSAFFGWLMVHDHNLRNEIIIEFNQKQDELLLEKQLEFTQKLQELQKINDTLVSQSREKEIVIETQIITIEKEVITKDMSNEAPEYYKKLLKSMQKNFGDKK